jgi:hypothetical protein
MKLLIPALVLLSASAMAADFKFGMEGRFDYGNSTVKHETNVSTNNYQEKRSEFYSNILRLNASAVINENLSARFRYRLSSPQETNAKLHDLSFSNVDYFYIDHKTQWVTARIGKSSQIESVGREFFVAGTDFPVTSYGFGNGSGAAGTTGYASMNSAVYNQLNTDAGLYHVGLSLINNTAVEGQTFTLSAFNPQKAQILNDTAGPANDSKTSKMGIGAYYNGKFLGGLVQPTLGYTTLGIAPETGSATPANNGPSASYKLMAAGIRSEVAGFVIDADWKQYKRDNTVASATSLTTNADKTTSVWANIAYTWDMLTPFVTYIHDKYDRTAANNATIGDYKRDALSVGVQITPYKDNNFRYHVAYSSDVRKNELTAASTADTKVKANIIVAGIKFDL